MWAEANNADVDAGDGLVGFGMFINTLQNILDGSNGTSWSDNLKTSHFVSGIYTIILSNNDTQMMQRIIIEY